MITQIALYQSPSTDPFHNLAVEQYLLESLVEGQCILYLWQNKNTVVIGRNQNPWKECHTTLLQQEGGHLARRLSGGGAVFHDLGNLNFTFLVPQADYDLDRQLSVILEAVRNLGISAESSGRNDILAEGRKFSGNAFYKNGRQAYHHGTLLVSADMDKLVRYLNPSKAKLKSKGVDSVRSRVVNLRDLNPEITVDSLKTALARSFCEICGLPLRILEESQLDTEKIQLLEQRSRSWEWNYGQKIPFSFECEERFDWGSVLVQLHIGGGIIQQAKIYSDSMDWSMIPVLEKHLTGCRFDPSAIQRQLANSPLPAAADISRLLLQSI